MRPLSWGSRRLRVHRTQYAGWGVTPESGKGREIPILLHLTQEVGHGCDAKDAPFHC